MRLDGLEPFREPPRRVRDDGRRELSVMPQHRAEPDGPWRCRTCSLADDKRLGAPELTWCDQNVDPPELGAEKERSGRVHLLLKCFERVCKVSEFLGSLVYDPLCSSSDLLSMFHLLLRLLCLKITVERWCNRLGMPLTSEKHPCSCVRVAW